MLNLAVIAGGAGSRMGVPKGWLTIGDQPILAYVLDRISWKGPTLLVTSPTREHPPGWERFDREVVDPISDQGPLRGLVTALDCAKTDAVIAVTCDMPLIMNRQLLWLVDQLRAHRDSLGVLLTHCVGATPEVEPFPCAIRVSAVDLLRQRLGSSDRSIHSLAKLEQFALLPAPSEWPAETWTNLNYPEDLEAFAVSHPSTRVMRS